MDDNQNFSTEAQQNPYNISNEPDLKNDRKGFAITSLVLGIISVVGCCCLGLNFIAAVISLIFGIITLKNHYSGKVKAIIGVVLSSIIILGEGIIFAVYGGTIIQVSKDYFRFSSEAETVIENYEDTGKLPDYIEKYDDPKYDGFWNASGYDDIYAFMDEIAKSYDQAASKAAN